MKRQSSFTEEQIIGILREQEGGMATADVCRRHGISSGTFFKWKAKFGGMGVSDALGLSAMAGDVLADTRTGRNGRHALVGLLRQSVFGRMAGYEGVNDAERLRHDPAMRWIVGGTAAQGSAASPSQIGRFEIGRRSWRAGLGCEPPNATGEKRARRIVQISSQPQDTEAGVPFVGSLRNCGQIRNLMHRQFFLC